MVAEVSVETVNKIERSLRFVYCFLSSYVIGHTIYVIQNYRGAVAQLRESPVDFCRTGAPAHISARCEVWRRLIHAIA